MTKEQKTEVFKRHLKHLERPSATQVRLISAALYQGSRRTEADTSTGKLIIRMGGAR